MMGLEPTPACKAGALPTELLPSHLYYALNITVNEKKFKYFH